MYSGIKLIARLNMQVPIELKKDITGLYYT